MSDITLTAGVRQNLLSLQKTADLMATTQNRLATGKKVNSALDNPVSFFTSQALGDRANDLSSLLDSISNATQTLQAANNGLTSLTKLVQSAQAIAQQAQTSAGTTATVRGSVAGLTTSSATTFDSTTDTITVSDGTTTATFTAALASTAGALITAINNTASLKVKASLTDDGRIQLQATDASTVTVGGLASTAEKAQLGLVDGATTGGLNATRTSLATQFDALRSQIDQLAGDSGYNGVNLLNGDNLKVIFNEKGTSSQSISGVKFDSAGLGIAASSNKFQTDSDINTAFTNLTAALG